MLAVRPGYESPGPMLTTVDFFRRGIRIGEEEGERSRGRDSSPERSGVGRGRESHDQRDHHSGHSLYMSGQEEYRQQDGGLTCITLGPSAGAGAQGTQRHRVSSAAREWRSSHRETDGRLEGKGSVSLSDDVDTGPSGCRVW